MNEKNYRDNRVRAFADVVSIDAWHDEFSETTTRVDLHADVVFGTARIGGEKDAPVRFRLSVKRAEVVVVIPSTEPASVDRKSVARESTPTTTGKFRKTTKRETRKAISGRLGAKTSATGTAASAGIEANASGSVVNDEVSDIEQDISLTIVTQSLDADGNYRWTIEPNQKIDSNTILKGRPWDGASQPRLKLVDKRKDKSKGIPPTVIIEVICRREDIIIDDIKIKDESKWHDLLKSNKRRNNIIAAEAYIRERLSEEGLDAENIEDDFAIIKLGSVVAKPS